MTRTFRTEIHTPSEELKTAIGNLICTVCHPWIFEITEIEEERPAKIILVCKVTGKLTDVGRAFMEEKNNGEE